MSIDSPVSETQSTPKLVLIVDDDQSTRELLEFILKKEGFRAEIAFDGKEGFQKIKPPALTGPFRGK